jgi:hypothetical protein
MAKPDDGDVNRAAGLIAIYWAEMFVAITIVSLRMYARKSRRIMAGTTG